MSKSKRPRSSRGHYQHQARITVRQQLLRRLRELDDERLSASEIDGKFVSLIHWASADQDRYALVVMHLLEDVVRVLQIVGPEDDLWAKLRRSAPSAPAETVLRVLTDGSSTDAVLLLNRLLVEFDYRGGPSHLLSGIATCTLGLMSSLGGWFAADCATA